MVFVGGAAFALTGGVLVVDGAVDITAPALNVQWEDVTDAGVGGLASQSFRLLPAADPIPRPNQTIEWEVSFGLPSTAPTGDVHFVELTARARNWSTAPVNIYTADISWRETLVNGVRVEPVDVGISFSFPGDTLDDFTGLLEPTGMPGDISDLLRMRIDWNQTTFLAWNALPNGADRVTLRFDVEFDYELYDS